MTTRPSTSRYPEHRQVSWIPNTGSFPVLVAILLVGTLVCPIYSSRAAGQAPQTISEAFNFLAQEKTVAEDGVGLLKGLLRPKLTGAEYPDSIRLYSKAKAKYDGLIRQMSVELSGDASDTPSERFQQAIQAASTERITFTSQVDVLIQKHMQATKFVGWVAIFTTVTELLPRLTDVGIKIWKEWTSATKEQQAELKQELQKVSWRSFSQIDPIQ